MKKGKEGDVGITMWVASQHLRQAVPEQVLYAEALIANLRLGGLRACLAARYLPIQVAHPLCVRGRQLPLRFVPLSGRVERDRCVGNVGIVEQY